MSYKVSFIHTRASKELTNKARLLLQGCRSSRATAYDRAVYLLFYFYFLKLVYFILFVFFLKHFTLLLFVCYCGGGGRVIVVVDMEM